MNSFSVSAGQLQVTFHKVDYKLQTPACGGQPCEITLKYFRSYLHTSCIVETECITDFVVSACDCKDQGMAGSADWKWVLDSFLKWQIQGAMRPSIIYDDLTIMPYLYL